MRTVVRWLLAAGICWMLFCTVPGQALTGPLADPLMDGWRLLLTVTARELGLLLLGVNA